MASKKNYWRYILYALVIGVFLWPTSRIFIQRQLMKIGFFQPKLEITKETEHVTSSESTTSTSRDRASFVTESGQSINTEDLIGKVVFINFWATWCGPCIAEMPSIQVLYDKFKDNPEVVFLIVEIESNQEGAKEFITKQKLNLPIVFPNSNIPQNWLENSIPTTVILDKNGDLVERKQGMYDYSGKGVQDYIQSLIDKK